MCVIFLQEACSIGCALFLLFGGNNLDIKKSLKGCVDILQDFGIINPKKYRELSERVDMEDKEAYGEISVLLEEVAVSAKELAE